MFFLSFAVIDRRKNEKKPQTHLRPWLETSKQRELPFSA
jgi:hypothetical protein